MAKIFVRERRHVGQGDSRPRFAIVGVEGSDLKFFKSKVRQAELETIAQTIGAEVVMLPRGSGEHNGGGKERGRKRQKDKS
jgi:hypothetical protein